MDFTDTKSMFASKAVWGGIIAVLASIIGIWGYKLGPDDQAAIVNLITAIAAGVGGVMAVYGRVVATKAIK